MSDETALGLFLSLLFVLILLEEWVIVILTDPIILAAWEQATDSNCEGDRGEGT